MESVSFIIITFQRHLQWVVGLSPVAKIPKFALTAHLAVILCTHLESPLIFLKLPFNLINDFKLCCTISET